MHFSRRLQICYSSHTRKSLRFFGGHMSCYVADVFPWGGWISSEIWWTSFGTVVWSMDSANIFAVALTARIHDPRISRISGYQDMQEAGFINYYHGSSLRSFSKRDVDWGRRLGGLLVIVKSSNYTYEGD